jgi:hypothetical protein
MAIQGECMKTTYDLKPYFNRCSISWYQDNCRIFMDEFPEVEEVDLRVNFDTSLLMKRFMVKE